MNYEDIQTKFCIIDNLELGAALLPPTLVDVAFNSIAATMIIGTRWLVAWLRRCAWKARIQRDLKSGGLICD